MATEIIEMATISSRGQVCIPTNIREMMGLDEGSKVFFMFKGDDLVIRKASAKSWSEITKPLREEMKKSGMKESDVPDIIHKMRGVKP